MSAWVPEVAKALRTFLFRDAKNRSITDPKKSRRLTRSTCNSFLNATAMLLRYMCGIGVISVERYFGLKKELKLAKTAPRQVVFPIIEQLTGMRAYLYRIRQGVKAGDAGPKFDFMMLCGARVETANACLVEHFNPVARTLKLTHLKARAGEPTEKTVAICDELVELLNRLVKSRNLKPKDHFFKAGNNNNAFRSAARHVGIERWFNHACRDWFGTRTLIMTNDLATTAELMCHNDHGVTLLRVYKQICSQHQEATVRRLKYFPGATADSSLKPAWIKVHKFVESLPSLPPEIEAVILDRLLWLEDKLNARDFEAIKLLPGLAQPQLPISYICAQAGPPG